MKVKNIMFAGFASAILSGVCGAASAADYNLVTQGYVTEKLAGKADAGASYTKAEADALLEDKADASYVGTIPEGATSTNVVGYVQEKTAGIASQGAMTELTNRVGLVETDIDTLQTAMTGDGEGSVAQKISTALNGYATEGYVGTAVENATSGMLTKATADEAYAPASLSQSVTELSTTVAKKADASALDNYLTTEAAATEYQPAGSYVTTQDLTEAGYATTSEMETALQDKQDTITDLADIRTGAELGKTAVQPGALESYVTTQDLTEAGYATTSEMETALQDKQDTITDLDTIRSGAALGATAMQSIGDATVTKAMLAEGVQASLDAADTAVQPSALDDYVTTENLNAAGYQTKAQVEAEIAGATIQQSQVSGLDTALAGKLDDTMTAAGTYLVKRDGEGNISYVSVEIVGETPAQE